MKHNEPFEDDGRTVADMSGIEHDSIWLPRRRKQGHTPAQQPQQAADRPWEEDPQLTGKERLWAILGALKATLLICGVYLLGLLALLALWLWLVCYLLSGMIPAPPFHPKHPRRVPPPGDRSSVRSCGARRRAPRR